MPKQRITKDMVVKEAFELARAGGMENVLVKNIAEGLGCSVQPIYSYCSNIEQLKEAVLDCTKNYLEDYIAQHIDSKELFRSVGRAHALFAVEEPYLYRLYFLRKRKTAQTFEELYQRETNPEIPKAIAREMGISEKKARKFHEFMMIFNIGVSMILSTMGEHTNVEEIMKLEDEVYSIFEKELLKAE